MSSILVSIMAILMGLALSLSAHANPDRIEFSYRVETCLDAAAVFADLTLALSDSTQSEIWPSNRSQVEGPALPAAGERVRVTYKFGLFRRVYGYILAAFAPGTFTYQADEHHPFRGGATVRVIDKPGQGSTIDWSGEYIVGPDDRLARRFFEDFRQDFFGDLEANVRRIEQNSCKSEI